MTQKYQAILFDLDQTLLNRHDSLIAFCRWQAQYHFHFSTPLTAQYIQRFVELDANGAVWKDQVYAQLKQEFDISDQVEELVELYLDQFQNFCQPFNDVLKTLAKLHQQGYKLGLISNGRTPFQEQNFASLGLCDYFSCIIVSEAVGLRKPEAEIFLLACNHLNLPPQHCIFIGDNELADIQGAQAVGMTAIRFDPTSVVAPSITPSQASARFNDYAQLIKIIDQLSD